MPRYRDAGNSVSRQADLRLCRAAHILRRHVHQPRKHSDPQRSCPQGPAPSATDPFSGQNKTLVGLPTATHRNLQTGARWIGTAAAMGNFSCGTFVSQNILPKEVSWAWSIVSPAVSPMAPDTWSKGAMGASSGISNFQTAGTSICRSIWRHHGACADARTVPARRPGNRRRSPTTDRYAAQSGWHLRAACAIFRT